MARSRSIAILKNAVTSYFRQGVQILVFFLLTPYTAHRLGTESFGLWSLLWAVSGLLGLANLGVSNAVVKFLAEARGRQDETRVRELTATFFWLQFALGGAALALALALLPLLNSLLAVPGHLRGDAILVALLLAFRVASGMPLGLAAGLLAAHRRQHVANLIRAVDTALYGVAVWQVLSWQPDVRALAATNLAVHLVSGAALALCARRLLPGLTFAPRLFRRALVREIASFSMTSFLVQVSSLLYTRVDSLVIQRVLSLRSVAFYSVAMQTVSRGTQMCRQLAHAVTPIVAELKGSGDEVRLRTVVRKGTKLSTALACPLLIGLIWLAPDLIHAWLGAEFMAAVVPLRLLAGAALVDACFGGVRTALTMGGQQRITCLITVAGQVLNLGLTIALVLTPLRLQGVALATLMASTVTCFAMLWGGGRRLGLRPADVCLRGFLPSLLPSGVMLGALQVLGNWLAVPTNRWLAIARVGLLEGVALVVFGLVFLLLGLSAKERSYFVKTIRSALRRKG
ncbi:MAG: oligosaccharide flippase family protein [Victivallales bacterium]|nr:oligosaccharide flippase family protein [Victivallales bacterium]